MLALLACMRFVYNRRGMLLFELNNNTVQVVATISVLSFGCTFASTVGEGIIAERRDLHI